MGFNAPYVENVHGGSPLFLPFWEKSIFALLHRQFKQKLYVGTSFGLLR